MNWYCGMSSEIDIEEDGNYWLTLQYNEKTALAQNWHK